MNLKKRGLGRGLEALLAADVSASEERVVLNESDFNNDVLRHTSLEDNVFNDVLSVSEQSMAASKMDGIELSKYQKIAEQSRSRAKQLQELKGLPAAGIDVDALSSVVRILIEDIQRDNHVLMKEAEALLKLIDEFDSIINGQ